MAAKEVKKTKRKNKRKSRTEVFSDGDSDSDVPAKQSTTAEARNKALADESQVSAEIDLRLLANTAKSDDKAAETKFAEFYLRQITQEFADDLDKLRTASDFNDRSVELLIDSLQKGTACFDREERVRVGRAGLSES